MARGIERPGLGGVVVQPVVFVIAAGEGFVHFTGCIVDWIREWRISVGHLGVVGVDDDGDKMTTRSWRNERAAAVPYLASLWRHRTRASRFDFPLTLTPISLFSYVHVEPFRLADN